MNNYLVKKFVKDHENTGDALVRESYGKLASLVGIAANAVLCIFKIGAGVIFKSVSILADGINNLSDASASLITLIGFKLSGKRPDKDHPYGHGRTEYLTGLAVSVMIIVIGVSLLKTSVEKTIHPEPLDFSILSVVILVVAIAVKLWLSAFNNSIGKTIDSDTLKATAADSRNDVISTAAVLLCLIIGKLANINLDGPVGILVALFITWSGIGLVRETISPILGQPADPELVKALENEVMAHEGVLGTHDMVIHDYGPGRFFASIHVEVDAAVDVMISHDRMDNIEKDVSEKLNIMLTVHMDPLRLDDETVEKARMDLGEVCTKLGYIKGFHDVRTVAGPTHTNVIFDVVVEHECRLEESQIKKDLIEGLKKIDPAYETVITVDRAYV